MKNAERKKQQPSNLVVSTCIPRVLMYVCLTSAGLDVSRSIVNFVMSWWVSCTCLTTNFHRPVLTVLALTWFLWCCP